MYITSLLDEGKSDSVILSAIYGIKWAHNVNDLNDTTESNAVKLLMETAKRIASKPKIKKDVVTPEMLQTLCKAYKDCEDVLDLREIYV